MVPLRNEKKKVQHPSFTLHHFIGLENVDNLQDISSMAPKCISTDVATLRFEVSSTKIWIFKRSKIFSRSSC